MKVFDWHASELLVGDRMRQARRERMWSKGRLVDEMHALGLHWWRASTVAATEAGLRRPSTQELFALTWVFSEHGVPGR